MHVPGGSDGKEYTCNVGDLGSISESRRSPGEGNDNPLQYSYLENPMDKGASCATVHWGHRDMIERLTPFQVRAAGLLGPDQGRAQVSVASDQ